MPTGEKIFRRKVYQLSYSLYNKNFLLIEPTRRHKKTCSMFVYGDEGCKFQKGWLVDIRET